MIFTFFNFLKGLLGLFQVTLCAKMKKSDLERYPWNLNQINNVEDITSFSWLEMCLNFWSFLLIYSCKQEMRKSLSQRIRKGK